jgi:hypothetical protein
VGSKKESVDKKRRRKEQIKNEKEIRMESGGGELKEG